MRNLQDHYNFATVVIVGRPVKCVHMSPVQTHCLLIAYGPVTDKGKITSKVS